MLVNNQIGFGVVCVMINYFYAGLKKINKACG